MRVLYSTRILLYIYLTGGERMSAEAIKEKSKIVDEIASKLEQANSAVVVQYRGLTVEEVTQLRRNLRDEEVELKVYKNKLTQRATEKMGYASLNEHLVGPNAIAFGNGDAVAPARVLAKFAKDHDALVLKTGVVEGKVLSTEELQEISTLPGRDGMYSMLLSMIKEPVSKFARVVKAVADAQTEDAPAQAE